ncbi:MAG: DUF1292 domain-containing protein [Defluviitaleaceae bacterium]|nr:DUF1292 domain-containing protein [Defluviitaleaceae bacterium]
MKSNTKPETGCTCGCGCGNDEYEPVVIVQNDGTEIVCDVIGRFEANGQEYMSFLPESAEEEDMEEILIFRCKDVGEDVELDSIDSEEEYAIASSTLRFILLDEDDHSDIDHGEV